MSNNNPVEHPNHYNWHPKIECIEISQEFVGNLAQAIQYLWRMQYYMAVDDIDRVIQDGKKAIMFIEFEIGRQNERKEKLQDNN